MLVRLRFSHIDAGQVTGYAVALAGTGRRGGAPRRYGGGRLLAELTLPRLRSRWDPRNGRPDRCGTFRFTIPERDAIFEHAARQAATAAEHIRCSAHGDRAGAADAAWAAADSLHMAARVLRNPELRRAADTYDRAARAQYGQIPRPSREGSQLRTAARLMALTGPVTGDAALVTVVLVASLVALAVAVAELREAQHLAAQSAAARRAAMQLRAASVRLRSCVLYPGQPKAPRRSGTANAPDLARSDVATSWRPSALQLLAPAGLAPTRAEHHRRDSPGRDGDPGRGIWAPIASASVTPALQSAVT